MNDDVEMANDDGADPTGDIRQQNPGATVTGDVAAEIDPDASEKSPAADKDKDKDAAGAGSA